MNAPWEIVFMVEEKSATRLVDRLWRRLLPASPWLKVYCLDHEGKASLLRSVGLKLKAWSANQFVILCDKDGKDCKQLKAEIKKLCLEAGRSDTKVCIVCRELEAWYWGDLEAVSLAYDNPSVQKLKRRQNYRQPDAIENPDKELQRHIKGFKKSSAADKIFPHMKIESNTSPSFRYFLKQMEEIREGLPEYIIESQTFYEEPSHASFQRKFDLGYD